MRVIPRAAKVVLSAAVMAGATGCGTTSDGYGSTAPAPNVQGTTATLRLSGAGLSQQSITLTGGGHVTFTNNDSVRHEIASNPHPVHTDCPALNGPVLNPGDSFTAAFANTQMTCGFHDHLNPNDTKFHGTVTVVPASTGGGTTTGGGGGGYGGGGYY